MTLWWLHGLAEDHKGGFCGHLVSLLYSECCDATLVV